MKRRSNSKRCLLCLAFCSASNGELQGRKEKLSNFEMLGAVNCHRLQKQMEHIFILRKILDVPLSWCEETLKAKSQKEDNNENCGDEYDDGNPASWFFVCDRCINTNVAEAWRIYQQILALEVKMLVVKDRIKMRMKEEMLKSQNKSWIRAQFQDAENGEENCTVDGRVRKLVFPDLKSWKSEEDDMVDGDAEQDVIVIESDNASNFSEDNWVDEVINTIEDDPLWDGSNGSEKQMSAMSTSFINKRGRGRPSKDPAKLGYIQQFLRRRKKRRGRPPKDLTLTTGLKRKKRKLIVAPYDEEEGKKKKKWSWHFCQVTDCKAKYTSLEELKTHQELHEERKGAEKGPLDCPHCPFPAGDSLELELHVKNFHTKENRNFHYSCPKCDFRIENDFPNFKEHFDKEHPPLAEELINVDDPDMPSSELPIPCPVCPKRCENLRFYTVHFRKMHPEHLGIQLEALECEICGVKFSNKLFLKSHINSEHKRHSRYVCDECGQGFQFFSRLQHHKIKHVNNTKRDFVCHLCGLDYAYKHVLEKHYRKYHPSFAIQTGGIADGATTTSRDAGTLDDTNVRVHACRYCEFTCTLKGIMIRHLQQHKQEVGHRCDQCGKCYVSEGGLKRHLRINHPQNKEEFPCPYCLKAYASVEYMRDHMTKFCRIKKMQEQEESLPSATITSAQGQNNSSGEQKSRIVINSTLADTHYFHHHDDSSHTQQKPENLSSLQVFSSIIEPEAAGVKGDLE